MGIKVYATVELAKYLEHQKKDYESALLVVNELMEYVLSNRFFGKIYLKELEKRKSRLERMAK